MPGWLAPVLLLVGPLTGVWLGACLKAESDREQWRRAELRTAFAQLLATLWTFGFRRNVVEAANGLDNLELLAERLMEWQKALEEVAKAVSLTQLLVKQSERGQLQSVLDGCQGSMAVVGEQIQANAQEVGYVPAQEWELPESPEGAIDFKTAQDLALEIGLRQLETDDHPAKGTGLRCRLASWLRKKCPDPA